MPPYAAPKSCQVTVYHAPLFSLHAFAQVRNESSIRCVGHIAPAECSPDHILEQLEASRGSWGDGTVTWEIAGEAQWKVVSFRLERSATASSLGMALCLLGELIDKLASVASGR